MHNVSKLAQLTQPKTSTLNCKYCHPDDKHICRICRATPHRSAITRSATTLNPKNVGVYITRINKSTGVIEILLCRRGTWGMFGVS